MPENPTKRLRYFDHQFLRADDFNAEQEYHLGRRRLHNRALHTWGIAEGLDLRFDTGAAVVAVAPGTAIDADGNEIVLTEERRVDLSAHPAGAAVYVVAEYRETPTDLSKETDIQDNTRWTEDPDIKAVADRPAQPSMQLILGKVNRSGTVISDIDRADRRAAGAVSGDITTTSLTLKRERVDPATWPRLSCSGANQAALEVGSLKLDAGREIFFADNGQIRSRDDNHRLVFNRTGNTLDLIEFGRIRLFTGSPSAERLTVSADGNVGIGRAPNAEARLDVNGNVFSSGILRFADGAGAVYPDNWIGMANNVEGTTKWLHLGGITDGGVRRIGLFAHRVHMNGSLGIGTTNPVSKLHIHGDYQNKGTGGFMLDASDTNDPEIYVLRINPFVVGNSKVGYQFQTKSSVGGTQVPLTFDNEGKVGIGTTSPGAKLSVIGGADTAVQIGDRALSGSVGLQFLGSGYKHAGLRFDGDNLFVENASSTGAPSTWHAAGQSINFIVRNGNVGIGTTAPVSLLHVRKDAPGALGPTLTLQNGSGGAGAAAAIDLSGYDNGTQSPASRLIAIDDGSFSAHLAFLTKRSGGNNNPLVERMRIKSDGSVGIGTNDPSHPLHVNNSLGIRQNRLYISGGGATNWSSISFNAHHSAANNAWVFPDKSIPAVTIEMDEGEGGRFQVWTTKAGSTDAWEQRLSVVAGKTRITGDLEVTGRSSLGGGIVGGGFKLGYVVDQFVNNLGEALELGDVVVLGGAQTDLYHGTANNIPIPEVDLTDTAHDTRVCGIVCEVYGKLQTEEAEEGGSKKAGGKKAAGKKTAAAPRLQTLSAEELESADIHKVAPGQTGLFVTLGAFAHCKVDADIAPIEVGDLLTTSPTRGHAQKVTDPAEARGAILGKALGALKKGKGLIPVIVTLQ